MKILKYSKGKGNKYIIHLDNENITLYDDLVIAHELLLKKEIDDKEIDELKKEQSELESYYVALKYLSVKMRSKREVREYLKRKDYSNEAIKKSISKLENMGYLNDLEYAKCYIHDKFVLSMEGPIKIKNELEKLGIPDASLSSISDEEWMEKLERLVNKKVKTYRHDSASSIKIKMQKYFVNLGYPLGMIIDVIDNVDIEESDEVIYKEALKIKNKLVRKYDGDELERHIKSKLYQKGFGMSKIDEVMRKICEK